jgi:hypothetical protein
MRITLPLMRQIHPDPNNHSACILTEIRMTATGLGREKCTGCGRLRGVSVVTA